ncbi:hypothetical protein M747DRAFT_8894 [Aspergillus niger ATCC 13496]|uniref:Uncharacterized protein n=1 Tax=Aspergillus niger ATCC 13496 TaxID=1353008 RepID=A0A370CH36_ASPNG|nr:hypothetical protein M747DRAFT_8894 [Aspergillus niger ATCC 13496]
MWHSTALPMAWSLSCRAIYPPSSCLALLPSRMICRAVQQNNPKMSIKTLAALAPAAGDFMLVIISYETQFTSYILHNYNSIQRPLPST